MRRIAVIGLATGLILIVTSFALAAGKNHNPVASHDAVPSNHNAEAAHGHTPGTASGHDHKGEHHDHSEYHDHPNPNDDNPIERLQAILDEVLAHIDRVNSILTTLPVTMCPDGKLTKELARDPRDPDLRVLVMVMEEFQVYFETEDQAVNKEIAAKLSRIQAVGPSAGVIIESSSQKPSGVGAGDVLIETPGELSPLLGWLATLPVAEMRVEPVRLQAVYDRFHGAGDE